jgi:hypothetical protein
MPEFNSIPYPADGDPPNGAGQMEAIARALPVHRVPTAHASGVVTVALNNSVTASAVVTFPVGRFVAGQAVRVSATAQGTSIASAHNLGSPTTTAVTVGIRKIDGTAATVNVDVSWHAIQGTG